MQIYHTLTPAPAPQDSAVALGYFDGVHSGLCWALPLPMRRNMA